MSRGYWAETELKNKTGFFKKRRRIFNILLPRTSLLKNHCRYMNNPLHWCIFYGDFENGLELFEKKPMLILEVNAEGSSPIEFLFGKKIKLHFYKESIKLVKKICAQFGNLLMDFLKADDTSKFVLSSDVGQRKFYRFMEKLKKVIDKCAKKDDICVDMENNHR